MNLNSITMALWIASLASSVYSIITESFTALILGVMFAFAAIAQEQFNNWR